MFNIQAYMKMILLVLSLYKNYKWEVIEELALLENNRQSF